MVKTKIDLQTTYANKTLYEKMQQMQIKHEIKLLIIVYVYTQWSLTADSL